jgi:hypothetical protein
LLDIQCQSLKFKRRGRDLVKVRSGVAGRAPDNVIGGLVRRID